MRVLGPVLALLVVIFVVVGTAFDSVAVMIMTASVVAPLVVSLGYDPIWWGVMMIILVEVGVVTPPFGINLFVLKNIIPGVTWGDVFNGVIPFILADLIKIILLIAFPMIVLWLPMTAH